MRGRLFAGSAFSDNGTIPQMPICIGWEEEDWRWVSGLYDWEHTNLEALEIS
jgi:hypothetical protein